MKSHRMITALLLCATAVLLAVSAGTAQDIEDIKYPKLNKLKVPEVDRVTLDNGLRLYLVKDDRLPLFNMSVRVNAGSYLEPADKVGLVSILGQVLRTGGTAKWTGDEIDEALESVGGTVETGGNLEAVTGYVDVLSEYSDLGLEVITEILRRPAFAEDKIELAKVQERSGIARRNDDPQSIGEREFDKAIYGPNSVYARQTEYATIDAVTRDDLVAFHDSWFHPENVQIAIWGDFDRESLLGKLRQQLGDWERGSMDVPPLPEVTYKYESRVYYIPREDVNQSNIFIGHIGGLTTDADYADRIVMNRIMGAGFSSRMFNKVRSTEGLAYHTTGVYTANPTYPGVFYNYVGTKSETSGKAIREVIGVIQSMLDDPPTDDEVEFAKDSYLNSFVFRFDTKSEVVNRLMMYDHYGIPEDFLQQTKQRIEKVTSADVVAAAKNNLRPDALRIVVVGKGEDFDVPLTDLGLGPVDTVDISIPTGEKSGDLAVTPETLEKGRELLAEAAESVGGLATIQSVEAVSAKGKITVVTPQGEFPISFEEVTAYPDKNRMVATIMGRQMYDVFNGKNGWETGQTGELQAKSADDIADSRRQMSRDLLNILRRAGEADARVVYAGEGELDGVPVEYVAILGEGDQPICRLALNSQSLQPVGNTYWGKTMMGEGNVTVAFSAFRDVEGLNLPMTRAQSLEGNKVATVEYSSFELNPVVTDTLFAKPE